jgi:chromosome segregation ATPase
MGSKELPELLHIFQTFRSLGSNLKTMISHSKPEISTPNQIKMKNELIESLQNEIIQKNDELIKLSERLQVLINSAARVQTMSSYLDKIQIMENQLREKNKEIEQLQFECRQLNQAIAHKNDTIKVKQMQLENLRNVHESSMLKLQPILQEQSKQMKIDHDQVLDLRNQVTLGLSRLVMADKMIQNHEETIRQLKSQVTSLETDKVIMDCNSFIFARVSSI